MFLIYVLFLIVSGIAMLVMASVKSGQTAGRRAWYAVFGAGFTLYGLYLLLFFPGGHYLVFFYAFILPVLVTVRFFRDRSAFRAKQQAAAMQGRRLVMPSRLVAGTSRTLRLQQPRRQAWRPAAHIHQRGPATLAAGRQ